MEAISESNPKPDAMQKEGAVKDVMVTKKGKRSFLDRVRQEPCLTVLVLCLFLWVAAPFAVAPYSSSYKKPSALKIVWHVLHNLSEFFDSVIYWAASASGAAIGTCFFLLYFKQYLASRIVALFAEAVMAITCIRTFEWLQETGFGIGFWGIMIFLLVVFLFGKKQPEDES